MQRRKFDLNGSRALVTGGGRGIGLASAEALAEHGAQIMLCDIDAAMTRDSAQDKAMLSTWMEFTPMRRIGRPDEIAAVALFLASPAASPMTGAVAMADAGYTTW